MRFRLTCVHFTQKEKVGNNLSRDDEERVAERHIQRNAWHCNAQRYFCSFFSVVVITFLSLVSFVRCVDVCMAADVETTIVKIISIDRSIGSAWQIG